MQKALARPSRSGGAAGGGPGEALGGTHPRSKRRLSNFLLDKDLQLRYVLLVVTMSGLIAGTLGYLLYHQRVLMNDTLTNQLAEHGIGNSMREVGHKAVDEYASENIWLVYKMIAAGLGLVVVLSGYLLIMTHKVAGPLFKVSAYFDKMADGQLGLVTPLRRGDMLQDFYTTFREMHVAVRDRFTADAKQMEAALESLRSSSTVTDDRGGARGKLDDALDDLAKHLEDRKKRLA
jgi:hypothetical protein